MSRRKITKLDTLEQNAITCPSCSLCGAKQVTGIKLYNRETLETSYECEECILKVFREKKRLKDEKAARREKAIATGKCRDKPEEDRYIEPEEWEKFEANLWIPIYAILWHFLWCTGARISEALNLIMADVNLEAGEVTITSLKRVDHLKKAYPLPKFLLKAITALERHAKELLFINPKGKVISLRMAQNNFKTTCRRAGIRTCLSPHSLRHSVGTRTWEKTHDLNAVKTVLRHSTLGNAERYMHLSEAKRKALIKKLQEDTT